MSLSCVLGRMAITRSMTRKQNHDAYSRKKFSASWSDLSHDVLLLILMKLAIIDFVAFSGVCKTWRSFALSNWNMFMASRRPMTMLISSDGYKKECCLENGDGRKFRTNIPHSSGRTCFGVTCGYLIWFGNKTRDFWLVNPITKHELHFPRFPFYVCTDPTIVRGILVFSSLMSGWVFVISLRLSNIVSFSLSGKQAHWTRLFYEFPIHDVHAFQGKIYTLNRGGRLYEVSLNPKPTLTLVVMNNVKYIHLIHPLVVSSGEFLYIMDCFSRYVYTAVQVDLDEMRWVRWRKRGREFAYYVSVSERGVPTKVDMWAYPQKRYERFSCFHGDERVSKGCWIDANMYYLPSDCLNVNLMSDKNDELK